MFLAIALAIICAVIALTGCNTTETEYDKDGKIAKITIAPSLAKKSYQITNQTTAFKIKTTPDSGTASTSWIEFIFGTSVTPIQVVAPIKTGETTPAMYTRTKQTSIWADLFGTNVSSGTESYIAASGETAAETAARLKALRESADETATEPATATDSSAVTP